jgi:uncharacterized protein
MPLVSESSYLPPTGLSNGHVQTIFPALFRQVPLVTRERERIPTPDGDFLDLDWNLDRNSSRLAILTHGLEGDSRNPYMQGMAAALHRAGWDVLAWNLRGCSGEPNRLVSSYHSGATGDLHTVIQHALTAPRLRQVALVGFSLGGNLTLKYLGDFADTLDSRLIGAVAFSVPCDLASSSRRLEGWVQRLYMRRFLVTLRKKIREKMELFPGRLDDAGLDAMRTFREFDGAYTAPLHGYQDANDYWRRASCKPVLYRIGIPTLLVNARNDPFLAPPCFPSEAAGASSCFHLEVPASGGHIGFPAFNPQNEYWSESRAVEFLTPRSGR